MQKMPVYEAQPLDLSNISFYKCGNLAKIRYRANKEYRQELLRGLAGHGLKLGRLTIADGLPDI